MKSAPFWGPISRTAEFQASTATSAPMTTMKASSGHTAPTSAADGTATHPASAATSVIATTEIVPATALSVV